MAKPMAFRDPALAAEVELHRARTCTNPEKLDELSYHIDARIRTVVAKSAFAFDSTVQRLEKDDGMVVRENAKWNSIKRERANLSDQVDTARLTAVEIIVSRTDGVVEPSLIDRAVKRAISALDTDDRTLGLFVLEEASRNKITWTSTRHDIIKAVAELRRSPSRPLSTIENDTCYKIGMWSMKNAPVEPRS